MLSRLASSSGANMVPELDTLAPCWDKEPRVALPTNSRASQLSRRHLAIAAAFSTLIFSFVSGTSLLIKPLFSVLRWLISFDPRQYAVAKVLFRNCLASCSGGVVVASPQYASAWWEAHSTKLTHQNRLQT